MSLLDCTPVGMLQLRQNVKGDLVSQCCAVTASPRSHHRGKEGKRGRGGEGEGEERGTCVCT